MTHEHWLTLLPIQHIWIIRYWSVLWPIIFKSYKEDYFSYEIETLYAIALI